MRPSPVPPLLAGIDEPGFVNVSGNAGIAAMPPPTAFSALMPKPFGLDGMDLSCRARNQGRAIPILLLVLICQTTWVHAAPVTKVLAVGEVDPAYCPLGSFGAVEPSLDVTLAIARDIHGTSYGDAGLKRLIRLYVPRTLEAMVDFDLVVLNQPVIRHFPAATLRDMRLAIVEYGKGAMCFMESQYPDIYMPWLETELSECFPYNHYAALQIGTHGDKPYDLEIVRDEALPALLRAYLPLGIESIRPYGQARATFPREGATVWAYCRTSAFAGIGMQKFPLFISWRYGPARGLVWTTADQFDSPMWRSSDGRERYALDIFAGIAWLSAGWGLPQDPVRVHVIRESFGQLRSRIGLVNSVLEFADNFGANTRELELDLSELGGMEREAGYLYLEHEFDNAQAVMQEAFDLACEIEQGAVSLKERALTWVYAIEWLAVTSTMSLAGWALWSLMIRRTRYRMVATTRFLE